MYADLTPTEGKVERLFRIRPSVREKHFQNRVEKYQIEAMFKKCEE